MKKIVIEGDFDPMFQIKDMCPCSETEKIWLEIQICMEYPKDKILDFIQQFDEVREWERTYHPDKEKFNPFDYIWRLTLEPIKKKPEKNQIDEMKEEFKKVAKIK